MNKKCSLCYGQFYPDEDAIWVNRNFVCNYCANEIYKKRTDIFLRADPKSPFYR